MPQSGGMKKLRLRIGRIVTWRTLPPIFTPSANTAAARTARAVRRFHASAALALILAAALAAWLLVQRVEQAAAAASDAAIAARQPALALRLAQLNVEKPEAGDGAAFDRTLDQLQREQAGLIAGAGRDGARQGPSSDLRDLYLGPGYALQARLDDLYALARHVRASADDAGQADFAADMRREITGPIADRLARAAELLRLVAAGRMADLARAQQWTAVAAAALAAAWLAASLLLDRRLRRTLGLLEWLAARDGLTGALTRSAFTARLHQLLKPATPGAGVGIVLFDLDHFHALNATSGDDAGDAALRAVARRLLHAAPAGALVARLGSDTFAVAIPGVTGGPAALARMASLLLDTLADPVPFAGKSLHVSATGGTALAPQDSTERSELLRMAGVALREAKRASRGSVNAFHSIEPTAQARREAVLRALIACDMTGVEPWLQPLVDCKSGQPVRLEVLARWTHPQLGPVPPAEFIPIAEAVGRLPLLSAHVRNSAIMAMADLHKALQAKPGLLGPGSRLPGIAVNLAPSEMAIPGILGAMQEALAASGLGLDMLTIEVTEAMLVEGVDAATQSGLQAMQRGGTRLNLDNFGGGLANLSHLHGLELDGFKIARSFIAGIGEDTRAEAIIRGLVGLGRGLGVETVAEGIETQAQLDFARAAGCDVAQGYFIGRPMPVADIPAWFSRRRQPIEAGVNSGG